MILVLRKRHRIRNEYFAHTQRSRFLLLTKGWRYLKYLTLYVTLTTDIVSQISEIAIVETTDL